MTKKYERFDTKLIHSGERKIENAVSLPIFQSSTFVDHRESYHDLKYIRLNNTPNHSVLHDKLASLENAEAALVTASGMAAISTALLTVLSTGDHLLAQNCLYGGTHDFVNQDLQRFGISTDHINLERPDSWEGKLRPNTKAIYVETITNPLIEVGELEAVVAFAEKHGLVTLIDNTFATPLNFRPSEWGFDISLHSGTKYLNGHSDICCGAVIGKKEWVTRILHLINHLGGSLDPHACFLLHRGLKTLGLRVRHQNQSGRRIAEFLQAHPGVERVHYAGLPESPSYKRAQRYLNGGCGSTISFELKGGGLDQAEAFLAALTLPTVAPSLGGVESLITLPAATSHSNMTPAQRALAGFPDYLIRISVGIEDPEDLVQDLEQALVRATSSVGAAV